MLQAAERRLTKTPRLEGDDDDDDDDDDEAASDNVEKTVPVL